MTKKKKKKHVNYVGQLVTWNESEWPTPPMHPQKFSGKVMSITLQVLTGPGDLQNAVNADRVTIVG